jgi:Flp pilus assembly protein TadG
MKIDNEDFMRISIPLKRLYRNDIGAVILLYALALVPIIGMLGIAIDTGRIYYVNSILTGAVDAAAIAGGRAGGTDANITQSATNMFNANIPPNFIGTITGPTINLSTDSSGNRIVAVTANARINTSFMQVLGQSTIATNSLSQAVIANLGAEVVLALDNTGSMDGSPMQAELDAAKQLVETVYGGPGIDTVPGLYMAIVPFTTTVNINLTGTSPGFAPSAWLTSAGVAEIANPLLYPPIPKGAKSVGGSWMGCIEARTPPLYAAGMDATDTPPTSNATRFTPYLYPSTMVHKYTYGQALDRTDPLATSGNPPWGSSGTPRGDNDWTLAGGVPAGSGLYFGDNYKWNGSDGNLGVGPNLGCPIPILPLTASQTVVQNTIKNMKATFRGGTMINSGLAAAWWTISPSWTGLWPSPTPSNLPQAYGKTNKFLVLMTDGNNQWYDWPTGVPGAPSATVTPSFPNSATIAKDADYTGYGRLGEGRTGTTNFNSTIPLLNASMTTMCDAIKKNGVVVYTILFTHGGTLDPQTQTAFKNCASDPSKYYYTITNAELVTAFKNIGQSISSLRLSWPGSP